MRIAKVHIEKVFVLRQKNEILVQIRREMDRIVENVAFVIRPAMKIYDR